MCGMYLRSASRMAFGLERYFKRSRASLRHVVVTDKVNSKVSADESCSGSMESTVSILIKFV